MLNTKHFIGALSQMGVPVTQQEAEEVMAHYSVEDADTVEAEIPIADLLNDAVKGAPGLLDDDQSVTGRLMGSSQSHRGVMETSETKKPVTTMIKAFRAKLRELIDKRVRHVGGSPGHILKSLLLNWDTERNGALDNKQLRGALRTFNMRLSATQAAEVSRHYAKNGNEALGCDSMQLVEDVCGYDQGPFVYQTWKEASDQMGRGSDSSSVATSGRENSHRNGDTSDRTQSSLHFTARPRKNLSNRLVDKFKLRLRDALEQTIKNKGGVSHAIIREAFLDWDTDASGKLNPRELVGALKRMGVRMTDDEANATVAYYDLDGTGEMSYELLCKEIEAMSHPMLSYIEEVDVLSGLDQVVREPVAVKKALESIRAGVAVAARRAAESPDTLPPILGRDLLEGTCLRFDTQDNGVLGVDELRQIWRELKISLRKSETKALVAWFDRSTANRLHYADLCDAIFGRSSAGPDALYSSRKQEERRPLQQAPPRPHVLQAQRSAALALGESSSSSNSSVAYATPLRTSMQELKRLAAEKDDRLASKTAWNWQGHPPAAGDRNPEFGEGYRKKSSEPGSGDPPGSGVAPVRFRGVLKASGEAIVAEKARIEKRLKEVQRERALLLREKKRVECWRDTTTGRGRTTSSTPDAPANKCGA
ncbi:unnamed protein product [Pylaiella littoralis]